MNQTAFKISIGIKATSYVCNTHNSCLNQPCRQRNIVTKLSKNRYSDCPSFLVRNLHTNKKVTSKSEDCLTIVKTRQCYIPKVANQSETKNHISYCVIARVTSYTWAHMNITPSLPHSNTYLGLARFIVNITHQHDNDRTLQGIYCYACYLVELLIITWEPHETGQTAACGARPRVGYPCYILMHQNRFTYTSSHCNTTCSHFLAARYLLPPNIISTQISHPLHFSTELKNFSSIPVCTSFSTYAWPNFVWSNPH